MRPYLLQEHEKQCRAGTVKGSMFEVLNVAGKRGLTIEEMLKQMKASGLKAPGGLTPVNTIQGLISQHNDIFVRTDAGKYALQGHLQQPDGTTAARAPCDALPAPADGAPGQAAARAPGCAWRGGPPRRTGAGRGQAGGKRRRSEPFGSVAKRPKLKRRPADEESDDGEWRLPAVHANAGGRAAPGPPLFLPMALARATGPSPVPPQPRPGASEPPRPAAPGADTADDACARRPARSAPAALGSGAGPARRAGGHPAPASSAHGPERCPLARRRAGGAAGGCFGAEVCSAAAARLAAAVARPRRQAAAAAEAAAREARLHDAEDGEGDEKGGLRPGFGPSRGAQLVLRAAAAAAAAAAALEPPAPPGFEPCVRTTDAKPDGWTEYTAEAGAAQADCPAHGEKRFDRLTKVAAYLREHCRCRREWTRLGPQSGEGEAEHLERLRPLFSFSRRASPPADSGDWMPGPLGVLADVACGFERDADWDRAPAKAPPRGTTASACAPRTCHSGYVATESDSDGSETADDAAAGVKHARAAAAPARPRGPPACALGGRRDSGAAGGAASAAAPPAGDSPAQQHRAVLEAARAGLGGDTGAWADFAAWLVGQPAPALQRVFDTFVACARSGQDVKDVVLAVLKRNPPPLPAVHREHAGWRLAARAHSA